MTVPENEIERLLRLAVDEPGLHPLLFRALLDARLYAHVPLPGRGPNDGRVRFVQWTRPDGVTVIPCFASELKARLAGQARVRVAAIDGRQLMEATRGATLHLDPNDFSCTLSPADITALLTTGSVAIPDTAAVTEEQQIGLTAPASPPEAMLQSLAILYGKLGVVRQAFLVELREPAALDQVRALLVGLRLDPGTDPQCVAQDSTTVIRETYCGPLPVDLIALDETSGLAQSIAREFSPFYVRTVGASGRPGPA